VLVAVWTDMLSLRKPKFALIAVFCSAVFLAGPALAQEKSIAVVSTTSTKDSGLFEHLLPLFTLKTGIAVKVRALGTGQALDVARRGDADVVFVHAKLAEQTFVAEGHGVKRYPATAHVCYEPIADYHKMALLDAAPLRTQSLFVFVREYRSMRKSTNTRTFDAKWRACG
jgi:ABC-type tungstate transport system permease subunit